MTIIWMVHKLLLDDLEVRGRDHSQRPQKTESVNVENISIRIITSTPDNSTTKRYPIKSVLLLSGSYLTPSELKPNLPKPTKGVNDTRNE